MNNSTHTSVSNKKKSTQKRNATPNFKILPKTFKIRRSGRSSAAAIVGPVAALAGIGYLAWKQRDRIARVFDQMQRE